MDVASRRRSGQGEARAGRTAPPCPGAAARPRLPPQHNL
ncbi:hypothetical protein E1H18_5144 [Caulobacter sp. RHG1]|nr:hypothetical protein [Caulobacter sp. RHG1]